jgi:UDP-N-acetylmuramate dehydrogenase
MHVEHDVPLAPRTTIGIGGSARRLVRVTSVDELRAALATDDRVLLLGGGSNVVIGDAGWDGTVIAIGLGGVTITGDVVRAGAGVPLSDFVAAMVEAGRAGVECLAGIPGLVGATPMQNVGAYGQDVAQTIERVTVLDRERDAIVELAPEECEFGYRTSRFKGSARWVITEVAFRLPARGESAPIRYAELATALGVPLGGTAPLARTRETVIALRRTKGMVVDPADPDSRSVGSFFTNPIVAAEVAAAIAAEHPGMPSWPAGARTKLAAAWLIERAGFARGHVRGRVGTSSKHALALINRGGATAAELFALVGEIQAAVRARFGVALEIEPLIIA